MKQLIMMIDLIVNLWPMVSKFDRLESGFERDRCRNRFSGHIFNPITISLHKNPNITIGLIVLFFTIDAHLCWTV